MGKFAKSNKNGVPLLEENSYSSWKQRMRTHIQSTNYALWEIIKKGYVALEIAPTSEDEFKVFKLNLKAVRMLHEALDEKVFDKIGDLRSAKEIWDKLEQRYEGTSKSKELRLKSLIERLHQIEMRTDEDIRGYQDHAETLVSKLKGLGKDDISDNWVEK